VERALEWAAPPAAKQPIDPVQMLMESLPKAR